MPRGGVFRVLHPALKDSQCVRKTRSQAPPKNADNPLVKLITSQ